MRATNPGFDNRGGVRPPPTCVLRLLEVRDPRPSDERNDELLEVVLAYRSKRSWSALLLELLAVGHTYPWVGWLLGVAVGKR
jgi:hypothetical protein